jgi:hypothetical protein
LHFSVLKAVVVAASAFAAAACAPAEQRVEPTDPCGSLVIQAATAREIDDQLSLFDRALSVCRSLDELDAHLQPYPDAIAVPTATLVEERCRRNPELQGATLCRSIPTTTVDGSGQDTSSSYVGITLDGREIELTPDQTAFREGRPLPIIEIEQSAGAGCEALQSAYRSWRARTGNPVIGDEASVYAQFALDLLRGSGCEVPIEG